MVDGSGVRRRAVQRLGLREDREETRIVGERGEYVVLVTRFSI